MSKTQSQQPDYGASLHYLGSKGEAYFKAQAITGKLGARWNLNIWNQHIYAQDDILDFGCGGGYLLSILPGRIKIGVEINPAARKMAESLGVETFETLDEVEELRFSRVISSHALEHVPAPLTALKQLRSNLADGGKLLLLLPLDDWRTKAHRSYHSGEVHHHLYAWTPQNLGNLLNEAGFKEIKIKVITDAMPPNLKLTDFLLKNINLRSATGWLLGLFLRRRQLFAHAMK